MDVRLPVTSLSNIPQNAWTALEEERPAAVDLLNQVQDGNIPLWMMIPIAIIILLAVLRLPTLTCLAAGIVSATVMGAFIGTITSFSNFMQQIYDSFADAGSWIVIMVMWVTPSWMAYLQQLQQPQLLASQLSTQQPTGPPLVKSSSWF